MTLPSYDHVFFDDPQLSLVARLQGANLEEVNRVRWLIKELETGQTVLDREEPAQTAPRLGIAAADRGCADRHPER